VPAQTKFLSTTKMIFGLLCGNAVIMYIDRTNMSVAAPVIQHQFGLNNVAVGVTFSAFSIAYAAFMVAGGRLGDIIGSRRGLTICGIIWALGTVLTGIAGGLISLVCARIIVGIGESAIYPIFSSVVGRWIPVGRRGLAQGVLHGFGRLGAALAPVIVVALILNFSWRWAFIILGIVSLLFTVVIWTYLRDDPRLHPGVTTEELENLGYHAEAGVAPETLTSPPMDWPAFLRRVWPVTAVSFCYGWFSWFLISWVPLYFTHVHGLSLKRVAIFSTMVLFGGGFGMIFGGFATDWWMKRTGSARRARRDIIIFSFITAMLCIFPLLFSADLMVDASFLALGYFMIELADPSIWMLGMEVEPTHAATSTAMVNTGFAVAGIVSPLIVGWLLDVTGSWTAVFVVSICILLIGPFMVWQIRFNEDAAKLPVGSLLQNIH
jgi:MFS family permease